MVMECVQQAIWGVFFVFYYNFKCLCEDSGISESAVLTAINVGRNGISRWREGGEPQNKTKKAIADYFHITVSELTVGNENDQKKCDPASEDVDPLDIQIMNITRKLTPEYKRLLLVQLEAVLKLQQHESDL